MIVPGLVLPADNYYDCVLEYTVLHGQCGK